MFLCPLKAEISRHCFLIRVRNTTRPQRCVVTYAIKKVLEFFLRLMVQVADR
jgi:hypothetical protein